MYTKTVNTHPQAPIEGEALGPHAGSTNNTSTEVHSLAPDLSDDPNGVYFLPAPPVEDLPSSQEKNPTGIRQKLGETALKVLDWHDNRKARQEFRRGYVPTRTQRVISGLGRLIPGNRGRF